MPLGVTSATAKELRDFNESLARKVAEAAAKEDEQRMATFKARREDMRKAFIESKTVRTNALDASAQRHAADIARFESIKAKHKALEQAALDKIEARREEYQAAHRVDARRGAAELEATLRRLGIDNDESRPTTNLVANTTIIGAHHAVHRAPRDSHSIEITEEDLQRIRRRQNEEFVERIRTRRVEDVDARRDKDKRQWRMEGELTKTAVELSTRNERAAWIDRAREIAPYERQRAFEHLKASVTAAAVAKQTHAAHEGLRQVSAQHAADVDAKFAVVAAQQRIQHTKRYAQDKAQFEQANAPATAEAKRETEYFCNAIAQAVVGLTFSVVDANNARIQKGAATTIADPLPVSDWRRMVETALAPTVTAVPPPRPPSGVPTRGTTRMDASALSPLKSRSALPTPAPSRAGQRPKSADVPPSGSDEDILLRGRAEELASVLLDKVADADATWLRKVLKREATALADEMVNDEYKEAVSELHASEVVPKVIFLVGALADELTSSHQHAGGACSIITKHEVVAQCTAAAAAAEAEAELAASAAKTAGKGGAGGKGAPPAKATGAKPEASTAESQEHQAQQTPLPTPVSVLTSIIENGGHAQHDPALRCVVVGFTDNEVMDALTAVPSKLPTVAVVRVEQPVGDAVHRLKGKVPEKKLDPTLIHAALHAEIRESSIAGKTIAAKLDTGSKYVERGVAVVEIEGSATVEKVVAGLAAIDVVELCCFHPSKAVEAEKNAIVAMLAAFDDEISRPHLKTMRTHEIESATVFRDAAESVVDVLKSCNLPRVPPPGATPEEQQAFWGTSDHVRTVGMAATSEAIGECRAAFAEIASTRLHTACNLLVAVGEALLGPASDGALVAAPTEEQCRKHMGQAVAEFALLPSTTEGSHEREQDAFRSMLTATTQLVHRTFTVERPNQHLKLLLWQQVARHIANFCCLAHEAASWWYHDLLTASAIWLQNRLSKADSRIPGGIEELMDAASASAHEVNPPTTPGRVDPGKVMEQILASVPPQAEQVATRGGRCFTPFSAKHLRFHGVLCDGEAHRALLSAQVACLSAFTEVISPDTLFLPTRQWWFANVTYDLPIEPMPSLLMSQELPPPESVSPLVSVAPTVEASRPNSRVAGKPGGKQRAPTPPTKSATTPPTGKDVLTPSAAAAVVIPPPAAAPAASRPISRNAINDNATVVETVIPPCRFGLYFDVAALTSARFEDLIVALGLGAWSQHVNGTPPAQVNPLPTFNTVVVRGVAAKIGDALFSGRAGTPEEIERVLQEGVVAYPLFASLPCWANFAPYDVRTLWELLSADGSTVPVSRVMRVVVTDAKSDLRVVDNVFVFAKALQLGSKCLLSMNRAESDHSMQPRNIVAALLPGLSLAELCAGDVFGSTASKDHANTGIHMRSLTSPWGKAVLKHAPPRARAALAEVSTITFELGKPDGL